MADDATGSVKSADRALNILEYLASTSEPQSLGDIAKALEIPKSSLHGLLRTMQNRGWVQPDGSGLRYWIGPRALSVGAAYLARDRFVAATADILDELSLELGETVHLGSLNGPDIVYLAKRDARHSLRLVSGVGVRLPAYATALGKVLLSELTPAEVRNHLVLPMKRLTQHTIVDVDVFEADLRAARERGYAIDEQESTEGVRCFAVALGSGRPRTHAISCSVPLARLDSAFQERVISSLLRAAGSFQDVAPSLVSV